LNQQKKLKGERTRLVPRMHAENLVHLTVEDVFNLISFYWQTTVRKSRSNWFVRSVSSPNNIWM